MNPMTETMDMQHYLSFDPALLSDLPDGIYAYLQQEIFSAKMALDSDAWIEAILIVYQGQPYLYGSEKRIEPMNSDTPIPPHESLQTFLAAHRNLLGALSRKLMQPLHGRTIASAPPMRLATTVVGHW